MNTYLDIDPRNKTAAEPGIHGRVFFLKGRYADGVKLAFYSCNPCSHVRNQDRGYVLIDERFEEVIDEVAVCDYGYYLGESRETLKAWRREHGKLKYYCDELGEHIWKMSECL